MYSHKILLNIFFSFNLCILLFNCFITNNHKNNSINTIYLLYTLERVTIIILYLHTIVNKYIEYEKIIIMDKA